MALKEASKLKIRDLRWAIVLKIVQSLALVAAGAWALFSSHLLYKKDAERSATYGCFATTTLKVDPIPSGDGQKSLYLVTVDTLVRNDTNHLLWISKYRVDFYVGKTLAGPGPGFFVAPPELKQDHPTIDWKHFGGYSFVQADYETAQTRSASPRQSTLWQPFVEGSVIGQTHDNKESEKDSEPKANSNESNIRESNAFLIIPAGQSWKFENQFVISASENDWIATNSVLIHSKATSYPQGDIPETRVENIGVALRRGSEITPASSLPGSNPASR